MCRLQIVQIQLYAHTKAHMQCAAIACRWHEMRAHKWLNQQMELKKK